MEYARQERKHIAVIPAEIIQADLGSTDLLQVSWKLFVLSIVGGGGIKDTSAFIRILTEVSNTRRKGFTFQFCELHMRDQLN